ncbi:N-(5'-phosphoribosyl)anthranilate isomerase [Candidatus Aerophobetes bacterium Ae_b3a]|nr:MAG: N-(5'-phosphoribosyl)anthranilate isomerase [Candidatus Aerophobetes bacterium Ae_b3a]
MIKIKICGITNKEDAGWAVDLKVDALGFIFADSPRRVKPEIVQEIIKLLPPFISSVGVFVNEDREKVEEITESCGLTTLQFHGQESPSYCEGFKQKIVKAFRIKDKSVLKKAAQYQGKIDAYLLDAYSPFAYGGTGKTFDWHIAKEIKKFGLPIILSGGLNPENIREAISEVEPYGVDVSSGVEERPGKKNLKKLKNFVRIVRETDGAS